MEENIKVDLPEEIDAGELFGNMDENLRLLKETMDVEVVPYPFDLLLGNLCRTEVGNSSTEDGSIAIGESLNGCITHLQTAFHFPDGDLRSEI